MTALLLAVALLAGYLIGRTRPARRVSDWADRLTWRRPAVTRREWRWWAAQPVYACQIAVLLATQPRETVRAWQTRNDPPPPRSPAVKLVSPWPPPEGPR
ncbi:hypothetical protein [Streptomyces sp. H27-H5]|uniref:hypothetical protein n=1 Tax=Streptomyces sp. H27-H5 TaxID=2996460 RepID=UPI00226FCA23|nr:hypothetical protein [Streptomyces sp. H27-H5]MCY0960832.1 hypothetical protein [Streptomyces sp. H27-H5]